MRTRLLWMAVTCLMAVSLLLVSCSQSELEAGGDVVEEKEANTGDGLVKVTLTKIDGTKIEKMVPRPKYGGIYNAVKPDSDVFDPAYTTNPTRQTPEDAGTLQGGDATRGPAGTNEIAWDKGNFMGYVSLIRNEVAESYSIPDDETIIFKIRKGVRFGLNPDSEASSLVGGREITAEDVAYSINRQWTSEKGYHYINNPDQRGKVIASAIDDYTLELKIPENTHGLHLIQTSSRIPIIAREVIEKYGDMQNWENSVGVGPFILTGYIPGSSKTFVKNTNYFERDPWFPENQLPYLDGVNVLIIPDKSTQQAALRTGKIDSLENLSWEEAGEFKTTSPEILQQRIAQNPQELVARTDREGVPYGPFGDENALKVRRAMNMAIDKKALVDDYFGGNAELFAHPWPPVPEFEGVFVPLEEYPREIQELWEYNPEKAKQLLAEAGYPDGFKTVVTTEANKADYVAILQNYLNKVGIEITSIDVKELAVYNSILREKSYPGFVLDINRMSQSPVRYHAMRAESNWNYSGWEHPFTRQVYDEIQLILGRDDAKLTKLYSSISDIYLENALAVYLPMPYTYSLWWPWLNRYNGANNVGSWRPDGGYWYWIWMDTDMKATMGY